VEEFQLARFLYLKPVAAAAVLALFVDQQVGRGDQVHFGRGSISGGAGTFSMWRVRISDHPRCPSGVCLFGFADRGGVFIVLYRPTKAGDTSRPIAGGTENHSLEEKTKERKYTLAIIGAGEWGGRAFGCDGREGSSRGVRWRVAACGVHEAGSGCRMFASRRRGNDVICRGFCFAREGEVEVSRIWDRRREGAERREM